MKGLRVLLVLFGVVLGLVVASHPALAHMGAERFKVEKRVSVPPKGPRGQLELRSLSGGAEVRLLRDQGSDYTGSFEIRNTGPGPLSVTRVFVMDAEDDPRSPPGLVTEPEGGTRTPIAPGQSRKYWVTWHSADARAQELYANLVVDSDAAQPDATVVDPPKLISVVAQRRVGLGRHSLVLLVLLPLLVALLALASRFLTALRGRALHVASIAIMLAEVAVAAWTFVGFDRTLAKRDGNDGLQFIERFVLAKGSGIELFLAVDGLSIGLVLAVSVVGLVTLLATDGSARRAVGATALASSGAVSVLVAQTSFVFLVGWAIAIVGTVMLTWDTSRKASAKIAIVGALSTLALGFAASWMSTRATGYLSDASETVATYSFPDLARAHFATSLDPMLGLPGYRAAWLLSFLGGAAFLPLVPLHGWLKDLAARGGDATPTPAKSAWATSALPMLSGYAVLRLCIAIAPDGAHWGAESLPLIGVILLALGGLWALTTRNLGSLAAHWLVARAGLFILLAYSLTPEGIEAAVGLLAAQAVASCLFVLSAGTAVARLHEGALRKLSGLGRSAPILSAGILVGGLGLAAPLMPGLFGPLIGLVGSLGRNPALTCVGALAMVLTIASLSRAARVIFGEQPAGWRSSKYLEPFGGVLPDLYRAELVWAGPLFALALLLAIAPRIFLGPADSMIRDLTPRLDPDGPTRVAREVPPASPIVETRQAAHRLLRFHA